MANQSQATGRVALASFIGTTIEWYDFFLYGTASAVIFSKLFFPSEDELVGTLLSFATFGVAFIARPFGGMIFGHFGDRIGRKPMLVITLLMMGVSTCANGLLPTYDSMGVAAPILLVVLRLVQGLSVGGEYGGAVLMTVEHSESNRRGWYGSWVQAGSPAGLILANGVYLLVTTQVSDDQLFAWAWRIPFLVSFVLVIVGLVIRISLEETPEFKRVTRAKRVESAPLLTLLRSHKKQVLLVAGAYSSAGVTVYTAAVYSLGYGTKKLSFTFEDMLWFVILSQIVAFVLMPAMAKWSDTVGHKKVFMWGIAGMTLLAFPWLILLRTESFPLALIGFVLLTIPYSANYGTMAAYFASAFHTRVGYSGLSLGYQFGTVVSSAVAPFIATALVAATGTVYSVGVYIVVVGLISLLCSVWLSAVPPKGSPNEGSAATPEPDQVSDAL